MATISSNCIDNAKRHCEFAQEAFSHFSGDVGYDVQIIELDGDDYVIVRDGGDTWLATLEDYQMELDSAVEKVLAGSYICEETNQLHTGDLYSDVICNATALYSMLGGQEDWDWFCDLTPNAQQQLVDQTTGMFRGWVARYTDDGDCWKLDAESEGDAKAEAQKALAEFGDNPGFGVEVIHHGETEWSAC